MARMGAFLALVFSVVRDRLIANGVRKGAITFARDRPSRYETEKNTSHTVVRGPVLRSLCLKQDGQDVQDGQDAGHPMHRWHR